jgi:hypothetical protein
MRSGRPDVARAGVTPLDRLRQRGYCDAALDRVSRLAGGRFDVPADILHVLDNFPYEHDWSRDYAIRSAQASLLRPEIMCINAAILAYALLDAFPGVRRQLIALHRRGPDGVECGHVVTAYWRDGGRLGAFSKSNYPALAHRPLRFASLEALAVSFAAGYLSMGFTPLYYGTPSLEQMDGADWRLDPQPLTQHLARFIDAYEYEFDLGPVPQGAH